MDSMKKRWHRYHYKNLTYLAISFIIGIVLIRNELFHNFLITIGDLGYVGAFIGGALFVSTFTISIGAIVLALLAKSLHPLEIGVIAGCGAVFSDFVIFHFIRSKELISEVKHFFDYFGGDKITHLLHSKYFSWTLPVIGAIIIASPLPDELGVGLMGISRMKTYQFIIVSFLLNSIGISLVITVSTLFKL